MSVWQLRIIPLILLLGLGACVTLMEGLSPSTRVYAMQKEFNDIYLPPIRDYVVQDFCDITANPPLVVGCADAKTVIALNSVAQEMGTAIAVAQVAVRDVDAACSVPDSPACTDTTKLLALAATALRAVLARVASEFIRAGLDK